MEYFSHLIDFLLHLDLHLGEMIALYGPFAYLILFLIIFAETGFVLTPFLPGDSLLFAAGAFAATQALDLQVLFITLCMAAILGDTTNYWVGRFIGPSIFSEKHTRFLNRNHLLKTEAFYRKHGGKTVIFARFLPIFRTFAPFIAGIAKMYYLKFLSFSVSGTFLWISLFVFGGYFFGNIPFVKEHFSFVILGIIAVSMLPMVIHFIGQKIKT